jgi:hypothetical protein
VDELEAMKSHVELAAGHLLQALKCAAKLAESQPTAPNTGSPKLPLDVLKKYHRDFIESYYCADGFVIGADAFISFVERQLRASA